MVYVGYCVGKRAGRNSVYGVCRVLCREESWKEFSVWCM